MISAGSMEELLVKVKTWETEMEKKGLRVNMGKTKIMESGINLDVLKKSGKYPCGVCLDTGYPHDGRADKDSYPHDGRAD